MSASVHPLPPEPRQPGRGYSWAPFKPDNEAAAKHGARSERKLQPIADELIAGLRERAAWTAAPVFEPSVQAWAWVEAQCILYRRWFAEHGIDEGGDEPPASIERWDHAERRALSLRTELGLSPSSFTKLLRGLSSVDGPAAVAGLDALRQTGAELRRAADRAALTTGAADGDEDQGDDEDGAA